ncbi:dipeptide epimerase [Flavobacterium luteum]|uniref:Dipeptide epimerase n=1 Tax=Flavobacterium luteum TaxID=2026654 RepID=A0A7J5AKD8_9FLAO|nr:dipeptide epimerase [Flavobacterium luteum]KAB1158015.1 dipeptide epimerase [Flavobacterium luteum]
MGLHFSFQFHELPLQYPFTISRYTVSVQKTVIVTISNGMHSGYGEATVNPYYHSTQQRLTDSLMKVKPIIETSAELHPEIIWKKLALLLQDDYFALCAVDMAYWDIYAKINSKTLRSYWADEQAKTPLTSYTIGIDSLEIMKQKIIEKPWPIYKIKLGTPNDIQIVENLRKITNSVFRIDANCAWTAKQTIENSKILKYLNVEFIEQPLKSDDIEGMKKVKSESYLPIIADESCQRETDVSICSELFHGINIKLMKCGGITPALRMIKVARESRLLLMAGCMTESTIGISGLTQIASLLDYLDADGALLLRQDIASGVTFNLGNIVYSNTFGTGAKLYT